MTIKTAKLIIKNIVWGSAGEGEVELPIEVVLDITEDDDIDDEYTDYLDGLSEHLYITYNAFADSFEVEWKDVVHVDN